MSESLSKETKVCTECLSACGSACGCSCHKLGSCECGAALADAGPIGIYCTAGTECPVSKFYLRAPVDEELAKLRAENHLARILILEATPYVDSRHRLNADMRNFSLGVPADEPTGTHCQIGGEDRSSMMPDWGKKP